MAGEFVLVIDSGAGFCLAYVKFSLPIGFV